MTDDRAKEIIEGIEVILAEMAKWHAALAALHADVREIKRCVENLADGEPL